MLGINSWIVSSLFVLCLSYLAYRLIRTNRSSLDALALAFLPVFFITGYLLLLGLIGWLKPGSILLISLLGLASMALIPSTRRALAEARAEAAWWGGTLRGWWGTLPRWLQGFTLLLVAVHTIRFAFLIWALPPFVWDSLVYHLTNVAHWTQSGRIELFHTSVARIYTPANYEVLATWFTVFNHQDVLVEAAGLPAYVIAVLAVYSIGRTINCSRSAAWIGALAFGSTPAFLIATTGTKNDPHMAAYFLSLVAIVLDLTRSREEPRGNALGKITLLALIALLAAGTKAYLLHLLPGVAVLGILAARNAGSLSILVQRIRSARESWRVRLLSGKLALLALVLAGMLLGGYWNVRNWVLKGNPFYPYGVTIQGAEVFTEGDRTAQLAVDRLWVNLSSLRERFGDGAERVQPDLTNTTGWGWFFYGLGLPVMIWATIRKEAFRLLLAGFVLSLLLMLLSIRPSPWNMRYLTWFPALASFAYALFLDELTAGPKLQQLGAHLLFWLALGLNIAMTLNYNRISADEFRSMLRLPARERHAALFEDNMPTEFRNANELVPPDAVLGYNVRGNGFIYPLYRADFAQRIVYIPFSSEDSCKDIAETMKENGTRYLLVAAEHTYDSNIAKLRECAAQDTPIRERARGLYVVKSQ